MYLRVLCHARIHRSGGVGWPLTTSGMPSRWPSAPQRVVSLVPSITEALAATAPGRLVGATDWCTHPRGLAVQRVRGTKNPDLKAIAALEPDLVVANKEENRELDVRRLRASGIPVWVTDIETVPGALDSLERLFVEALEVEVPAWLTEARAGVGRARAGPDPRRRGGHLARPVDGRRPRHLHRRRRGAPGVAQRLRRARRPLPARRPHRGRPGRVDVVLLPDEPYVFTAADGPEAFSRTRTALVSGRLLTWYGPSLVGARDALSSAVGA